MIVQHIEDAGDEALAVEWWDRRDFEKVVVSVNEVEEAVGVEYLVCDCCDGEVHTFPVPVVSGWCLCRRCLDALLSLPAEGDGRSLKQQGHRDQPGGPRGE
jgi:hypothetical protein